MMRITERVRELFEAIAKILLKKLQEKAEEINHFLSRK